MPNTESDWDRSHDWVVRRVHRSRCSIFVVISDQKVVEQLMAIRRLSPEHRNVAPAQIRSKIVGGRLALGVFGSMQSNRIKEAASKAGLQLEITGETIVSYLPFDRTSGMVWVIEDDAEAARVAKEMIDAGASIEEIEVD